MVCLNKNNPDVIAMINASGMTLMKITMLVNKWMKENPGENRIPNLNELGISIKREDVNESIKDNLLVLIAENSDIKISNGRYIKDKISYSKDQIINNVLGIKVLKNNTISFKPEIFFDNNSLLLRKISSELNISDKEIYNLFSEYVNGMDVENINLFDIDGFVNHANSLLSKNQIFNSSFLEFEERDAGFRNKDNEYKRFIKEEKAREAARTYNIKNRNGDLRAKVVSLEEDSGKIYYNVKLEGTQYEDYTVIPVTGKPSKEIMDIVSMHPEILSVIGVTYTNEDNELCFG